MKLHELKINAEQLSAIFSGQKTCEIRKNDRNYRVGDKLHLKKWMSGRNEFDEGVSVLVEVTHINGIGDGVWDEVLGLPEDIVVLSFQKLKSPQKSTPRERTEMMKFFTGAALMGSASNIGETEHDLFVRNAIEIAQETIDQLEQNGVV